MFLALHCAALQAGTLYYRNTPSLQPQLVSINGNQKLTSAVDNIASLNQVETFLRVGANVFSTALCSITSRYFIL